MNNVFYKIEEKEYCDEDLALSILLKEGILFSNSRDYSFKFDDSEFKGHTIVLFVNCSDIFAWALSDGEDLTINEVPILYKMWEQDKKWGSTKWCCKKRNQKPQKPVVDLMKKDGSWEKWMDDLDENGYDKYVKTLLK